MWSCGAVKDAPTNDPGSADVPSPDIPVQADLGDTNSPDTGTSEDAEPVDSGLTDTTLTDLSDSNTADIEPPLDEGVGGDETSTEPDPGSPLEDSLGDVASVEDPGQSGSDPGQPDLGSPDPGQPDLGQPDPGQPDPGQPDPGQSDPGPGEVATVDTGGCDLPPPHCPGSPAPTWELEDMSQDPSTTYGLSAFSGHVVVLALFSAT